jgi:HD-GYP domain-containing protein (c-di-GMP phosphodiesterase class II)
MTERVRLVHRDDLDPTDLRTTLARVFSLEVARLSDIGAIDDLAATAVIFDLDLSDEATVARLRRHLPRRDRHARLFLVEPQVRAERVQAEVLGASAVVARPCVPDDVVERLRRASRAEGLDLALGRGRLRKGTPGETSILAAEDALTDLFTACLTDARIDPGRLEEAGSLVSRSIGEIGFEAWMKSVRRHHDGTYQHCLLVTGIAVGFGTGLGMSDADVERLARAALAHDAGKARVPVDLLDKPGRLTDAEFDLIKMHPEWGWAHLKTADVAVDPVILDAVLHHHEALDGSGYPHGLRGGEIEDLTRVLTICDIYGALSERRAYKLPMPARQILEVLRDLAAKGKVEGALVRALDWIVTGERPPGFAPMLPRMRLSA